MTNCWSCGVELIFKQNTSLEHIIPDALGGMLTSYDLLCKWCNSRFGNGVDAGLIKQLEFYVQFINPRRDNPRDSKILGYDEEGNKRYARSGFQDYFPLLIRRNESEIFIYAKDKEENDRLLKIKMNELDKKGIKYKTGQGKMDQTRFMVYPSPNKYHNFLRVPTLKGLAKIAVNYHIHTGGHINQLAQLVSALKDGNDVFPQTIGRLYNPIVPLFLPDDTEISHTIYLKGDPNKGVFFAYVELLNFYSALFIIDMNYSEEYFEKIYCFDLVNERVVKRDIAYSRPRTFFIDFPHITLGAGKGFSSERLDRFLRVINLEENREVFMNRYNK